MRLRLEGRSRLMALLAGVMLALSSTPADSGGRRAVVLEVDGAISPAAADYVVRELGAVNPADTSLVVLRLDTPGGLDTSMREIIRTVLASPVPVAVYVAPSGARAASAGTYILYAGAVAAMAPGTNLGAATPIPLGGMPPAQPTDRPDHQADDASGKRKAGDAATQPQDARSRKVTNDAVAYIRSLAALHGRNADWAAEAVREAVSLPASEALTLKVIDVIADDVPDLLRKINGRTVIVAGKAQRLATADLEIATATPNWRVRLLAVITDPNVAYLLLLLGIYGLVFELANPGAVLPGVLGGVSFLVALFALNLLPIDYAGAALLLVGIALMVAEAFIGSFGVIGVGGIAAFVVGAIMMFPSRVPEFKLSPFVIAVAAAATAGLFLLVLAMLLRSRRRAVITGKEALLGAEAEVVGWEAGEGRVRVAGEIWRAQAAAPLQPGTRVRVTGRDGLVLRVEGA
jgi:membrane-bound serine protease (ClpP class)